MKVILIKHSGETIDVTQIAGGIKIRGASKECSRVLDMPFLRPDINDYLPNIEVSLGDAIDIFEDSKGKREGIFKGVIWEKEIRDNDIEQQITAYDKSIYLNKSDPKKQVFNKKSPDAITQEICGELGLDIGELAKGEELNLNCRGMKAYDSIMYAYTKLSKKNKKKYKLVAKGDKIEVFESGKKHPIVLEELNEPIAGKLLNINYRETLDDLVNKVEVIESNEKDKKDTKEEKKDSQEKYGVVQKIIRGEKADVKGELQGAKRVVDVECFADWDMITGMSIEIKSKVLEGEFYIIEDEHEVNDGVHTAKLKLSTEFEMDEREEGQTNSSNDTSNGTASKNIESALDWAHQQIGTPYSQAKRMQNGYYDCSSFALDYGKHLGVIPNGYNWATKSIPNSPYVEEIPRSELKRGDLLCWPGKHVEIYLGDGKIIHSTPPKLKVSDAHTSKNYKAYRFKGA